MKTSTQHDCHPRRPADNRAGTILVITAIVLVSLIGLLGLVIDAGQLMTAHRVAQNAADAGATAAALDLLKGKSHSTAIATSTLFVQQHNALPDAAVSTLIPPSTGPHAGNSRYVQVIVNHTVPLRFIQILGTGSTQTVTARAVAGYEKSANVATVVLLDPTARPGFYAEGNAYLKVNGNVAINSDGGGETETGEPINNGNSGSAIDLTGNAKLIANSIDSVGGLTTTGNAGVQYFDSTQKGSPLTTGVTPIVDPLLNLPTPTTANGAVGTTMPAVSLNAQQNVTLSPGVYPSITLASGSEAHLNPGIYVIQGGDLDLSGNSKITGTGVMIYLTGSDFNVNTGLPDSGDLSNSPPAGGSATFGSFRLEGTSRIDLTPLSDPSSPFDGIGFYQRRLNTQPFRLTGNSSISPFRGTIYAKWAQIQLQGNSNYSANYTAQLVVGSVRITGSTEIIITVDATEQNLAKVDRVFLVE